MDAPEQMFPDADETVEVDVVAQLFGTDPWMRFDLWANRAWESVDRAVAISIENGASLSDSSLDDRVVALFHSAQVAKEFAFAVNPLAAAACGVRPQAVPSESQAHEIMSMLFDEEE